MCHICANCAMISRDRRIFLGAVGVVVFSLWSLKLMSHLSVKKISNSLMHFFVLANLKLLTRSTSINKSYSPMSILITFFFIRASFNNTIKWTNQSTDFLFYRLNIIAIIIYKSPLILQSINKMLYRKDSYYYEIYSVLQKKTAKLFMCMLYAQNKFNLHYIIWIINLWPKATFWYLLKSFKFINTSLSFEKISNNYLLQRKKCNRNLNYIYKILMVRFN
jgi:hypothetical protein